MDGLEEGEVIKLDDSTKKKLQDASSPLNRLSPKI